MGGSTPLGHTLECDGYPKAITLGYSVKNHAHGCTDKICWAVFHNIIRIGFCLRFLDVVLHYAVSDRPKVLLCLGVLCTLTNLTH